MKKIVIALIKAYQGTWPIREPFVRMFVSSDSLECRFTPTCSHYTISAIEQHGIMRGIILGIHRVSRCRPGQHGGHDPVPAKITE